MENENIIAAEAVGHSQVDLGRKFGLATTVTGLLNESSPNQRAVLNLLALADRPGLSASALFRNFASETKGSFRAQVQGLAIRIDQGISPVEALSDEKLNRLVTPTSLLALRLATEEGTLPALYEAIHQSNPPGVVTQDDDDALTRMSSLLQRWYVAILILGFVMLKIVPEFQKMMKEFGGEMPPMMLTLMRYSDIAVKFWFIGAIFLVPIVIWMGRWYWRRFWPSTWQNRPITKSAKKRSALSLAIESTQEVPIMVAILKKFRPLKKLSKRFEAAHIRTGQGEEGWSTLAAEKLITKHESNILASSESSDTQGWLLRWFANAGMDRRDARLGGFTNFLIIAGNVALAALVLLMGLAVFSTLIAIMETAK